MTDAEFNDYAKALADAGADTKALLYMKRWKSLMKVSTVCVVCVLVSEYVSVLINKDCI